MTDRPIDALREAEALAKSCVRDHYQVCEIAAVFDPFSALECPECNRLQRIAWDAEEARKRCERSRKADVQLMRGIEVGHYSDFLGDW